jgi:hypothetical protein
LTRIAQSITWEIETHELRADLLPALSAIQAGVASGELSPAEAAALSEVVNRWTTAVEAVEFDARLQKLKEARTGNQAAPES